MELFGFILSLVMWCTFVGPLLVFLVLLCVYLFYVDFKTNELRKQYLKNLCPPARETIDNYLAITYFRARRIKKNLDKNE